jgi:P22 coat protein - gene protein 5
LANDIKVLTFIANDLLRQVKNNLQFVKNCEGEDFAGRFTDSPKAGETISVRKPTRYVGRTGETYTAEDYKERLCAFTVQATDGVDITLTNRELMFQVDRLSEKVIKPAAMQLSNIIDRKALQMATQATFNAVGTPGTIPNAIKTYNQARAKISWQGAPQDGHSLLITPDMQVEAVDANKAIFNPASQVSASYETGRLADFMGAKSYEIQNAYTHTVGPQGGAPLVNGANQTGATLVTDAWTAAVAVRVKTGDIFTIAGVYAVNPLTRMSTGSLQQFTATADTSSDGAGNATIPISPAIVTTGPFQNVTAAPADNAALTVLGAANVVSPVGLRFHEGSFLFGCMKQPEPGGVEFVKTVTDEQTGISLRFIRDWDTVNNKQLNRVDCVWAFGVAFPEWSCRIHS